MPELLIINPGRKVKRKTGRKAPRSAAQKAATRRMIAANRSRSGRSAPRRKARKARRSNPSPGIVRRVSRGARRVARRVARRRRNPIGVSGLGSARSYLGMFKDAAIQGAGAVAVDYGYSYVEGMLPAAMQRTPGRVGLGDAVKAIVTVAAGRLLSRPTRGLSMQAARGALVVQAHSLISGFVPGAVSGRGRMGWMTAAPVINGSARIGPNGANVGAYLPPGQTALLSGHGGRVGAYMAPGQTALLNGIQSAAAREGFGGRR